MSRSPDGDFRLDYLAGYRYLYPERTASRSGRRATRGWQAPERRHDERPCWMAFPRTNRFQGGSLGEARVLSGGASSRRSSLSRLDLGEMHRRLLVSGSTATTPHRAQDAAPRPAGCWRRRRTPTRTDWTASH